MKKNMQEKELIELDKILDFPLIYFGIKEGVLSFKSNSVQNYIDSKLQESGNSEIIEKYLIELEIATETEIFLNYLKQLIILLYGKKLFNKKTVTNIRYILTIVKLNEIFCKDISINEKLDHLVYDIYGNLEIWNYTTLSENWRSFIPNLTFYKYPMKAYWNNFKKYLFEANNRLISIFQREIVDYRSIDIDSFFVLKNNFLELPEDKAQKIIVMKENDY